MYCLKVSRNESVLGFGPLHCPYNDVQRILDGHGRLECRGQALNNTGVSVANFVLLCRVTFNLVKLNWVKFDLAEENSCVVVIRRFKNIPVVRHSNNLFP
jgi:hypothetical protein